jgi:hypothetical protein
MGDVCSAEPRTKLGTKDKTRRGKKKRMEPKTTKEIKSKCIRYSAPTPPAGQPKPSPAQTQTQPDPQNHLSQATQARYPHQQTKRDRAKTNCVKPTPPLVPILLPRVPPRKTIFHPSGTVNQPFPPLARPPILGQVPDNASPLTNQLLINPKPPAAPAATTQQSPPIHHQ